MAIRICEVYSSLQGEGLLTGTPSWFVRTSGCNLRCGFCDTPFASWEPEGENWSVETILQRCQVVEPESNEGGEEEGALGKESPMHVVITGGEPMLWGDLPELCQRMRGAGRHVTIETAGTVYLPLEVDLMSISPKMSNSRPDVARDAGWHVRHEAVRHQPAVVERLMGEHPYQLKFVVSSKTDAEEALEYIRGLAGVKWDRVMMMPEGVTAEVLDRCAEWLVPWCQAVGVQYCDRAHIRWYGSLRGK